MVAPRATHKPRRSPVRRSFRARRRNGRSARRRQRFAAVLLEQPASLGGLRRLAADQAEQALAARREDEVLAIAALLFRTRLDETALQQDRLVVGGLLLQRIHVADPLPGLGAFLGQAFGMGARGEVLVGGLPDLQQQPFDQIPIVSHGIPPAA